MTPIGRRTLAGYLFLSPALALLGLFTLAPFAQGILLSFQSWDGVGLDTPWVGLENYRRVFADDVFWASMQNALAFGLIGFVLGNALSLGMAVAVSANPRGAAFYRLAYYLPGVFSVIVVGMMFAWILQPTIGIVNRTPRVDRPRRAQAELAGRSLDGAPERRRRLRLVPLGLRVPALPGRAPGDPARALRGGGDRRGRRLAALPVRHLAAAPPGHDHRRHPDPRSPRSRSSAPSRS